MRILFLDDSPERHQAFARNRIGCEVINVWTAPEAIRVLDAYPRFDVAQLDHDLADEHYRIYQKAAGKEETLGEERARAEYEALSGTGMDVVDHIVTMPELVRPKLVIVHSFNASRAPEMVRRLHEGGVRAVWRMFDPRG